MKLVITAGDAEYYSRIRQHDRMVQRRFDLPAPLPASVKVESVGEAQGCAILQVLFCIECVSIFENHFVFEKATLRYNVRTAPQA